MKITRSLALLMCLFFLLSACRSAAPSYTPVFVEQQCPMEVPPGYKVRCGTVSVPEDRTQETGKQVILSIAVVEHPHEATGQTPVFVLTGGPGYGSLNYLQYSLEPYRRILAERPIIFYDQRGTGFSEPALDCPETLEANQKIYLQGLQEQEETLIYTDAVAACKARLQQSGISLSAYTTAASADDVRDIVTALEYPKVYLFGASYGTRLGQVTILRHQSEGWISGAILDSVVPMQVDMQKEFWPNTQGIFKFIFSRCAADPKCNARFPDLQKTFYATLEQLRHAPLEVSTFDLQTGKSLKVKIDDKDFVNVLFYMLYDPFEASRVPQIIDRASRGDVKLLDLPYRQILGKDYGVYEGMSFSVTCADKSPTFDLETVHQVNAALDPAFQKLAELNLEEFQTICQIWDVKPADARQSRALKTKLPVLILAGEQDPITPPAYGELLHKSIPSSYFYAFPGTGHSVFSNVSQPNAEVCAISLVLQFLKDSSQPPDDSCLSRVEPLPFRVPSN